MSISKITQKIKIFKQRKAQTIKYSDFQRRIIASSKLFDVDFYQRAAERVGLKVNRATAVIHYLTVGDANRIPTHVLFDTFFYHSNNRDIEPQGMTALFHFIQYGGQELRDPHPFISMRYMKSQMDPNVENALLFYIEANPGTLNPHPDIDENYVLEQMVEKSIYPKNVLIQFTGKQDLSINPSRQFDTASYRNLHPDTAAYHPLYHYLCYGKQEGRPIISAAEGVAGLLDQMNAAASLDPDVIPPHTNIVDLARVKSISAARDLSSLLKTLHRSTKNNYVDHLFFVPQIVLGGAEKVLSTLMETILGIDKNSRILVVVTDSSDETAANWLPTSRNTNIINIYSAIYQMDRTYVLESLGIFLQTKIFKNVYVLNSSIGWDLIEKYGLPLSKLMRLHAFAFCYDYDTYGRKSGYAWTHLGHCIDNLDTVITDNNPMIQIYARDLRLNESQVKKFTVLKQPVEINSNYQPSLPKLNRLDRRFTSKTVLWAGRFHKQKNVEVALKAANLLPDVSFVFAGVSESQIANLVTSTPSNSIFIGSYDRFDSLLDYRISLFLHTADWDGLPNVLLEAASCGIPIVARNIGGVSDLVTSETGWLADAAADENMFARLISLALSDSEAAHGKALAMLQKLRQEHNHQSYEIQVAKLYHH